MRSGVRLTAGGGALVLIVLGLLQPVEQDTLWLICLWASAPLITLFLWLSQPPLPRGLSRSVYNLGLIIGVGFLLLSLQLLRQQVVQAHAIYGRVQIDPESGLVTSNVRPVLESQQVIRGQMFDRDGALLVSRADVPPGAFVPRTYPLADVLGFDPAAFSNIIGFYSNRFGQSGLEATYGAYLSGQRGNQITNFWNGVMDAPQVGNDLHLTIDARLQAQASALLGGRPGSVVVLDPRTGEVLAMASVPGFDPRLLTPTYSDDPAAENARIGAYWQQINSDAAGQPLLNRPTQGQYPPGSTFKTVTAVAALEYPDEAQPDEIRCLNELPVEEGAPPVVNAVDDLLSLTGDPSDLERVYAYSCNVAFAQYALRLGTERMQEVAGRFDFFTPRNAPGIYSRFPDLSTAPSRLYVQPGFLDRPAALADTGYGQGQLLVTPLQMALVAAAVANDGVMMQPYLVDHISRPDGTVVLQRRPQEIRRVMSERTAAEMRENMRAVGEYGFGSGVNNFVPGVVVGGKSGTGEHVPGQPPHAWFIAIAPVDEPRYAVSVMLESGGGGSSVGAELAGRVLAAAFALET